MMRLDSFLFLLIVPLLTVACSTQSAPSAPEPSPTPQSVVTVPTRPPAIPTAMPTIDPTFAAMPTPTPSTIAVPAQPSPIPTPTVTVTPAPASTSPTPDPAAIHQAEHIALRRILLDGQSLMVHVAERILERFPDQDIEPKDLAVLLSYDSNIDAVETQLELPKLALVEFSLHGRLDGFQYSQPIHVAIDYEADTVELLVDLDSLTTAGQLTISPEALASIQPLVIEPLPAEREQALLKEYGDIAIRNQQSTDLATTDLVNEIIVTRVHLRASQTQMTQAQFDEVAKSETHIVWALYSQAPEEALRAFLVWSQGDHPDQIANVFHTMAARNQDTSSKTRSALVDRLISCQSQITRQLLQDRVDQTELVLRIGRLTDRLWAMLGSSVPERDIEVHTTLTCNRLA